MTYPLKIIKFHSQTPPTPPTPPLCRNLSAARCPHSWGRLNSNQSPLNTLRPIKESCFPSNLTTGGWTFLDDSTNSSVAGCRGVYRRILYPHPLRDVVWLEPHACFNSIIFANLVYACVNSKITSSLLFLKS